ncbi:toll/interleukin-1 receptor domain-containing protein [uncultured Stenotrophomonas sp.]|uniref:toll/interleukin-1 receptor domain-containing protein n=1 Tax=uncultured Stenotrophomonas sp. TaxID=165438 RepID=UPI0025FFC5FB|nr:toll/interleukin-1 receptor domain-containing protein [uncultured Stenotrophomonas sp.]
MTQDVPKLFLSYSWSSPDHEAWVENLAGQLSQNGVHVLFDKWDLREGNDSVSFMERMVTDASVTRVLIVSDAVYAEKADGRSGGVGTETSIISAKVYSEQDQRKFVVVLPPRRAGEPSKVPTYYSGRIHIDLSNEDTVAGEFEKLLRWIYDKPLHVRPEIGLRPSFLDSPVSHALGTEMLKQRAEDALRSGRSHAMHALEDYLEKYAAGLKIFQMEPVREIDFNDFIAGIEATLPARNEFVSMIKTAAQYGEDESLPGILHRFFERCLASPERPSQWDEYEYDSVRFLVSEIFIYSIALLVDRDRFGVVAFLLDTVYFVQGRGSESSFGYAGLYGQMTNDRYIAQQLGNKVSARGHLLRERNKVSGVGYSLIMQADILLWLRTATERQAWWFPITAIYGAYNAGPLESFARSASRSYFTKLAPILNADSVEQFKDPNGPWMKLVKDWRVPGSYPNFEYLLSLDSLGTRK